jgi:hypothetical protein
LSTKDRFETLCRIEGAWNDTIIIDGKIYKQLCDPVPYMLQYEKHPLPSNSNYREDIIYKRLKNLAMSQTAKEKLETFQRSDKNLRTSRRR